MKIDFKKLIHLLNDAIIGFLALGFFILITVVITLPLFYLVDWFVVSVLIKIGDNTVCLIIFLIFIGCMTKDIYKGL